MKKEEARTIFKEKRIHLSSDSVETESKKMMNKLLENFRLQDKVVHIFLPIQKFNEPNTLPFIEKLENIGTKVLVSKSDFNALAMEHYKFDKHQIEVNPYGIPEPVSGIRVEDDKIDAVIVPLLIFDRLGYRVGYGKGFYDRFLSKCRPDVMKIGVSLFEPIDTIEDVDEHDIKLDYCVTPNELFTFN